MKFIYETCQDDTNVESAPEWLRVRPPSPQGILFIPPLIGGNHVQQVRLFRRLIHASFDLISFNYSGHGTSPARFSLEATLQDTRTVLEKAASISQREGLPLFGIGACYSAIPLLHSAAMAETPFRKIILINAILTLNPRAIVTSFLAYYGDLYRAQNRLPKLADALRRYADFVFPGVIKNRNGFGLLERRRTRLFKTLYDAFFLDPLEKVRLDATPVLSFYSTEDRILNIYDGMFGSSYENEVRRVCPLARFRMLETDHFLSRKTARVQALGEVLDFLRDQSSGRSNPTGRSSSPENADMPSEVTSLGNMRSSDGAKG